MTSDKRTILLFTDWYEPGFKAGGPIQSCKNIVNTLSQDFNFYIFTSDRDLGDHQPYSEIQTDTWITLSNGSRIFYASPEFLKPKNIKSIIRNVNPGIVYLNSMFSRSFTFIPLWVFKKIKFEGRIILAPRGMLNKSALAKKKLKKKIFLVLFSFTGISKKLIFHATDQQEALDIKNHFNGASSIFMAENIPNVNSDWKKRAKRPGHLKLVFISRVHPIKNLFFALEVLHRLRNTCFIQFDVYGAVESENYFRKCTEAARELDKHVKVNFMGPLAHNNIFNALNDYHLFFLPTKGENFGHAIFEALSSGCPSLISDKTPWKDLEEKNAGWVLPLNNAGEFVDKLEKMCAMDELEFNELSRSAHDYANSFLSSMDYRSKYFRLFEVDE